jgi:hypothetical protein
VCVFIKEENVRRRLLIEKVLFTFGRRPDTLDSTSIYF